MRRLHWKPMLPMLLYLQFFSKMIDLLPLGQERSIQMRNFMQPLKKEAAAVVEEVWQWSHYLLPGKFVIITDQHCMSYAR